MESLCEYYGEPSEYASTFMKSLRELWSDENFCPGAAERVAREKELLAEADRIRYMDIPFGRFKVGRPVKSGVVYIQRWWQDYAAAGK